MSRSTVTAMSLARGATVLLFMLGLAASASAQGRGQSGSALTHRYAIVLEGGSVGGGPGGGLLDQFRLAGYNFTTPAVCNDVLFFLLIPLNWCTGPTSYPTQQRPGLSTAVTASYSLNREVTVAVGNGRATLGGAKGWNGLAFADSHWTADMTWAGVFLKPLGPETSFRIGAGPGLYRLHRTDNGSGYGTTRIGAMLETGFEVPSRSRLFVNLTLRKHFIPTEDVDHGNGLTLRPDWGYRSFSAGLGIRW